MTLCRSLTLVLAFQFLVLTSLWSQVTKEKADLIVTSGTVVTMDGARAIYDDGIIVVKGDTIVAVGPRRELEGKYLASETVNAKGGLVLPGFINGHTHVPMTLFRGIHDDVTLNDWLYKYIFPAEKKNVNEEFVRWGTRLAAAEQIRGGVTTFADMYYFEDAVAEETKAAGMRGVLGETFIDFPAPDNKSEAEALSYTQKFLKKWQGDPLIHAAAAPHSIYTCSQKTLQDSAAFQHAALQAGFATATVELIEEDVHWESAEHLVSNFMGWVPFASRLEGMDKVRRQAIMDDAIETLRRDHPGRIETKGRNHVLYAHV